MKIYTKTGDQGETSLFGGQRVKKSHPRVQAYGTLDEANSTLGIALSHFPTAHSTPALTLLHQELIAIQEELFQVGSELASPQPPSYLTLVSELEITRLESQIDAMEKMLAPLNNFILPGGHPGGATLHLVRTMVRRSERECVELADLESIRPEVIQYLNRLSDYLFVAARYLNKLQNTVEHPWTPRNK